MPIQNGQLTDADQVMNAFGILFKNMAQSVYNDDLEGFNGNLNGVGSFDKYNFDFRSGGTSTGVTASGNAQYDSTNDFWWGYPTSEATYVSFDEHDDSSVDAGLWDTSTASGGTVTEDTANMYIDADGANGSNAIATSIDIFDTYQNVLVGISEMQVRGKTAGGNTVSATANVYIGSQVIITINSTDTTQIIYTGAKLQVIRIPTSSTTYTYKWRFDDGTGGGYGSWNTSSETTDVQLKFECTYSTNGSDSHVPASIDLTYERFNTATDADSTVTTDAITHGSTITNAIGIINGTNATLSLSANNGSNYESVTDAQIHRFMNTGTQFLIRGTIAGTGTVNNLGAIYNFY